MLSFFVVLLLVTILFLLWCWWFPFVFNVQVDGRNWLQFKDVSMFLFPLLVFFFLKFDFVICIENSLFDFFCFMFSFLCLFVVQFIYLCMYFFGL
jgi:hypothetical protein